MCAKTCSHGVGVDFKVPVIIRSVVFNWASILFTCTLFFQTGQQYSAVEYTRASPVTRKVCAFAPQLVPASLCIMLFLVFSFCRNYSMCSLKVKDESRVTPRYVGELLCLIVVSLKTTFSFLFFWLFTR
jgi:hypothetical protein